MLIIVGEYAMFRSKEYLKLFVEKNCRIFTKLRVNHNNPCSIWAHTDLY